MTDTTMDPYGNSPAPVYPSAQPGPYDAPGVGTADDGTADVPDVVEPEEDTRPTVKALSESLNGFDQIAIRTRFHERFDQIAEDPIMFTRALYFVHLRREGMKDSDAFNGAMLLTFQELNEKFAKTDDVDEFEGDESAENERDRQYAEFIIGTGLNFTLEQYMELTVQQRMHIVEAAASRR